MIFIYPRGLKIQDCGISKLSVVIYKTALSPITLSMALRTLKLLETTCSNKILIGIALSLDRRLVSSELEPRTANVVLFISFASSVPSPR
jgi:hypothetical protein